MFFKKDDMEKINDTVFYKPDIYKNDSEATVYKLEHTSEYQNFISKIIAYDNDASFTEDFNSLSDDEIKNLSKDDCDIKIYQYQDDFGIKDFMIGSFDQDKGLEILANDGNEYQVIGYINGEDAKTISDNITNITNKQLIYQGGYYKYVDYEVNRKVETSFEDYILRLLLTFGKDTDI